MKILMSLLFVFNAWGNFQYPEKQQDAATDITPNLLKTGELLCTTYYNSFVDGVNAEQRSQLEKNKRTIIHQCVEKHRASSRKCSASYLDSVDKLANNEGLDQSKLKHIEEQLEPQLVACLDASNAQTKADIKTFGEFRHK